jgi:hypothetical protein
MGVGWLWLAHHQCPTRGQPVAIPVAVEAALAVRRTVHEPMPMPATLSATPYLLKGAGYVKSDDLKEG